MSVQDKTFPHRHELQVLVLAQVLPDVVIIGRLVIVTTQTAHGLVSVQQSNSSSCVAHTH